jgi:hypothetical protein
LQGCRIMYEIKHARRVITSVFFKSCLKIKENIISTATSFGRIGVGLWTKDRNPTLQSYLKSYLRSF